MEFYKQEFPILPESCDVMAKAVMRFCKKARVDNKDALVCRLSVEDCITYWIDHGFKGEIVTLVMETRMTVPYITLLVPGESCNPYTSGDGEYGSYFLSIQSNLVLRPEFTYKNGCNHLQLKPKKKSMNQFVLMGILLAVAAVLGTAGMYLPSAVRDVLLSSVVDPLYEAFYSVLKAIAGPMVFLSVTWGIYGIGDPDTLGRVGKRLIGRYLLTVVCASVFAMCFFPLLCQNFAQGESSKNTLDSITEMLFGIFPSSIFEPFVTGNTLQIIFLAVITGTTLLFLGKKTEGIVHAVEQVNLVVSFIMSILSKLVPYVIFMLVLSMIWSGTLSTVISVWKVILVFFAAAISVALVLLLSVSVRHRVSPVLVAKKMMPAFLIALGTASSSAAFSVNRENCSKKLGMDESFAGFALPLGMVIHRPVSVIYYSIIIYYFASVYNITCTPMWLFTGALVSIVLSIASPPVAGGGAIVYAMLFAEMAIPAEGIALALIIDMITDFGVTALEVSSLPLSMINLSSKIDMLDEKILRSKDV